MAFVFYCQPSTDFVLFRQYYIDTAAILISLFTLVIVTIVAVRSITGRSLN